MNKIILTKNHKEFPAFGKTKTYNYGNLWVLLDTGRVNIENPGDDTPAMVYYVDKHGKPLYSATYWCAIGESSVDGYDLSGAQYNWLKRLQSSLEKFLYD